MHGVRGDSARKNSKDAAAAGFERKLAHRFCGGALSSHQRGQFGSMPSLWLQELVPPCRGSGTSPVHMSNSALLIGNAGMSVRLACNIWWLRMVMGSRVRLDRVVRHARTMPGSCKGQPMPGDGSTQLILISRGSTGTSNSLSHAVAIVLAHVHNHIERVCHDVQQ